MGLISWIVVGIIAGALAKWIMPGEGPGGFAVTVILGMLGASVGGFVVSILGGSGPTGFNIWSILVATLGAVILLFLYGLLSRRTA
ncbi:MAG TPA: GlsB/YeaQ/YmgE family stress response membrane protein [Rubrobacter sp.]|nr:GlsB/YeaQ/YmgE family stress response membrane protein [Rubrobacter sp.]